ncbi:MAG: hypothetical protein JO372_01810, partial [Solirubrobacterales bacterium]|nr:hypothetical protein [Solirubrobacterales bacterium]
MGLLGEILPRPPDGVGVGVVERLKRGMSLDIDGEHLAGPRVENFKAEGVGGFKPEERDLDPVADAMGKLPALG